MPEKKGKEKKTEPKNKSKSKHKKVQVWKKYKVENGKVKRSNKSCPRCGKGTFIAEYKNRKYCGKCGWAKIEKK